MLRHLIIHACLVTVGVALTVTLALPASAGEVRASLSERSVYLLDSLWTDDAGKQLKLADLQGQYQILGFVFTQCGATCPMLVKSMQLHLGSLPANVRKRTRPLLISIDPEHDTPNVLRQYRRNMGLASGQWTLLHGNAASVRELTAVVGFNYDRSDSAGFVHSNVVTLLDPQGEIVHQQPAASDWSSIAEKILALEATRGAGEGQPRNNRRVPAVTTGNSQQQENS